MNGAMCYPNLISIGRMHATNSKGNTGLQPNHICHGITVLEASRYKIAPHTQFLFQSFTFSYTGCLTKIKEPSLPY